MTKNISDENVQVIDYHQHIAAKLKAKRKSLPSTLHFYDMFIWPLECLFAANMSFGEMLLQSRKHLNKAIKIVHIALWLTKRNYALKNLDYAYIYEELTKIRHLTFINLQTGFHQDIFLLSRIQQLNWPLSPSNKDPDCKIKWVQMRGNNICSTQMRVNDIFIQTEDLQCSNESEWWCDMHF